MASDNMHFNDRVEYGFVFIDTLGKIVDPQAADEDRGTLQDLVDEGWRIFHHGQWQMAAKATKVQAVAIVGGEQPTQQMMMLACLTMMRLVNEK